MSNTPIFTIKEGKCMFSIEVEYAFHQKLEKQISSN
jgi:hypothetical protein